VKSVCRALTLLASFCIASPVLAESYPERPVRVIVPTAAGGGADVLTRIVTQKLSDHFGKQFFVENIPGAGHNIGMGAAARAKPDGHTILSGMSTLMVNPLIYANVPIDPIKDFAPVSLLAVNHFVLVVHPSVPAKDARELIALIKSNPGKHNFASFGFGTTPHLLGEFLRLTFGLDLMHVPFNGAPPAINATLAGSTSILFGSPSLSLQHVREGKLRALAITSKTRWSELPDVPTLAEAGLPGEGADTMVGLLAPAQTPRAIIDRLNGAASAIMAMADVRDRAIAMGYEPAVTTPEEFAAYIKAETARWDAVVRGANLRKE
jgi:tripartite-type tricarboxylate transporter receptor subunit TctC